jgi:hypothetical protein
MTDGTGEEEMGHGVHAVNLKSSLLPRVASLPSRAAAQFLVNVDVFSQISLQQIRVIDLEF